MILTLDDIDRIRRAVSDPIPVGDLPEEVRQVLGLRVPTVHLSRQTLDHIKLRHPEIGDYDLLHLPMMLRDGMILREKRNKSIILAAYQDPESHKRYVAAMKLTRGGHEIWLKSMYRAKKKHTAQLLRKADLLRRHVRP